MAMHAGITGSTSGTVFNIAGTRVGVHICMSYHLGQGAPLLTAL